MTRLIIRTEVAAPFYLVQQNFDRELFEALLPPSFLASPMRYDGSLPGDEVHMQFHFPWRADWISRITESKRTTTTYHFIDEGIRLPFGLRKWKHRHEIIKIDNFKTAIVEDIRFSTGSKFINLLAWPMLFLAFFPRKWQYKSFFNKLKIER
jgi:ligand-binding SRPBCC domain-containing protein